MTDQTGATHTTDNEICGYDLKTKHPLQSQANKLSTTSIYFQHLSFLSFDYFLKYTTSELVERSLVLLVLTLYSYLLNQLECYVVDYMIFIFFFFAFTKTVKGNSLIHRYNNLHNDRQYSITISFSSIP